MPWFFDRLHLLSRIWLFLTSNIFSTDTYKQWIWKCFVPTGNSFPRAIFQRCVYSFLNGHNNSLAYKEQSNSQATDIISPFFLKLYMIQTLMETNNNLLLHEKKPKVVVQSARSNTFWEIITNFIKNLFKNILALY